MCGQQPPSDTINGDLLGRELTFTARKDSIQPVFIRRHASTRENDNSSSPVNHQQNAITVRMIEHVVVVVKNVCGAKDVLILVMYS